MGIKSDRYVKAVLTPDRWKVEIGLEGVSQGPVHDEHDIDARNDNLPTCIQAPYRIPLLHAFTRLLVYFFLSKACDPSAVKVRATSSTGVEVSISLIIERTESKHPLIHHLAANALMNDLEAGESWLHNKMLVMDSDGLPMKLNEAVRRAAQRLGTEWSISSKWTSFVAVDDTNKVQNFTRLYHAEQSDLSELTRPRFGDLAPRSAYNMGLLHSLASGHPSHLGKRTPPTQPQLLRLGEDSPPPAFANVSIHSILSVPKDWYTDQRH